MADSNNDNNNNNNEQLEKLENRVKVIISKVEELGFSLEAEIRELLELKPFLKEKILTYKLKRITYFNEGKTSVGFTMEDVQVVFNIEYGEDEEGPWYDASAQILHFNDDE